MPVVFAAIAGLTVAMFKIPIWQPLVIAIKMLGDISVPLLLFSLGVRMTDVTFGEWRLATGSALLRPIGGMLIFRRHHRTAQPPGPGSSDAFGLWCLATGSAEFPIC